MSEQYEGVAKQPYKVRQIIAATALISLGAGFGGGYKLAHSQSPSKSETYNMIAKEQEVKDAAENKAATISVAITAGIETDDWKSIHGEQILSGTIELLEKGRPVAVWKDPFLLASPEESSQNPDELLSGSYIGIQGVSSPNTVAVTPVLFNPEKMRFIADDIEHPTRNVDVYATLDGTEAGHYKLIGYDAEGNSFTEHKDGSRVTPGQVVLPNTPQDILSAH